MCFKKNQPLFKQTNNERYSGAIISHIGTQTERVLVDLRMEAGGHHQANFVIDTGSDWTVISSQDLMRLGWTKLDLNDPTAQMKNTTTATGEKMAPFGYVKAQLRYGNKQALSKIVVFEEDTTPLLSISLLKELDIVQINAQNTSRTETPLVNKIIAPLNEEVEVFLASEEDNKKKQIIEEFNEVFKAQSQIKEQFKIVM